jgi:hypothetical protein
MSAFCCMFTRSGKSNKICRFNWRAADAFVHAMGRGIDFPVIQAGNVP